MLVFKCVSDLQHHLVYLRKNGKRIAFVPTMGALHDGHLELIKMGNAAADISVASIFVNPTQFNDVADLDKYPRTMEADMTALHFAGCAILFAPSVAEVYPEGLDVSIDVDFGPITTVMEGEFRPGHFDGMATVVNRLLQIVQPDKLIMGQKDFQQLTIVRAMLRQLDSKVELVMCPTVREADGLAMSSRNRRLSPEMRAIAPIIHATFLAAKTMFEKQPTKAVEPFALEKLAAAGLRPEYFTIFDGISLQAVADYQASDFIVAATAAWAGDVRLIDNWVFRE